MSHLGAFLLSVQWFFLLYVVSLNLGYFLLQGISFWYAFRLRSKRAFDVLPRRFLGCDPPISVLVPAYNEEATITASVRSLLQLKFTEFEIIVINDGSKDRTLELLISDFALIPFPEVYDTRLPTKQMQRIYISTVYPNLRVIDKENGGKADALNAGINLSRNPLFCSIDADSILERDSLQRLVQPFLEDSTTVACGGTIRVANGCKVRGGFLEEIGLPRNILALHQIVEYLRAFLFGRMGWSQLNAMLIISGAMGLFHKDTVVAAGGYQTETIGEDMELVVRLHRHLRFLGKRYRITYVPDPVCWTVVPQDLSSLAAQRTRWQRGLSESLAKNWGLLFHPKAGAVGWLAYPFMVLFEWLGPLVEVSGYLFMLLGFLAGIVQLQMMLVFLLLAIGLGSLLSAGALMLDELTFHVYPKARHIVSLFLVALLENVGYRQMDAVWRLIGLAQWATGRKGGWGVRLRRAWWQMP